jgi:hypothetical protein
MRARFTCVQLGPLSLKKGGNYPHYTQNNPQRRSRHRRKASEAFMFLNPLDRQMA